MSSSNLEQLENNSASSSMQRYGACIEEFNANISFGNSIKWCKDENYIALQTNNTVYIKNVISEKRGSIVLNKESESEDGTVTTNSEPNRTSTHFKDRTVIHPSMFVRFLPSSFRSICWSSPIENYETFEITNEIGCLISCITSDNNCKIYKRPTQGYTTNWELVCDVRAILQENDKILLSIEKENNITVTPQGIIKKSGLEHVNVGDSITTKKTRNHVSKKTSSVAGLEQQFFSHFYRAFTEASGFDPSKEEYQVGYRKWTDEEQKIYEKVLDETLEYFKVQIEENSYSEEGLKKNLYVKLRTKMRKDKEKGKLTDINSPMKDSKQTDSEPSSVAPPSLESGSESADKKRKGSPSESQQPKKLKRLYFSRGMARARDEEVNQTDYNHCLYISEILCSDFSQPFKKSIDGAFRQSLYMVCGSKTGFLSIFVITNFDRKLEVELVGYYHLFSNFVSFVKFFPCRPGDDFFRVAVASCEGQIKILTIPKSYIQSVENLDEMVSPTEICTEYASYFESDYIPLTGLEILYIPSTQSKNPKDEMYMCYSKGTNLFVCKFEFQDQGMILTWRKKFSCQDFTISSISMQYISIDQSNKENQTLNTLLVYTTSLDGSLVQWKINEYDNSDDGYTSVYVISKNFELPVWGCSLSPNNVQMSISVERPPTKEVRADLEHRNKVRMYILPLFYHALRAIYHIPQSASIPSHCIIDYFATLLSRGLLRKQQAFDIADCLSSSDMVEYVEKILSRVYEIANNLPLKKTLYFLYSWICREKSYPLRETLLKTKIILEEELRYIYSVSLFDIQGKKHEKANTTQYLLCDWILLYYQQFVANHLSHNDWTSPLVLEQIQHYLPILDSIIKTLQNEECAEKNLKEIEFAQKLLALFTRSLNKENFGSIGNEIIKEKNFITPRDSCPVCKPTSEERFVPIMYGSEFSHSTCCSTRKHPIARDGFTFELIRDVYQMLECSCCCQQTSRTGLFSVLYQNCTQHNAIGATSTERQQASSEEEVIVDENLMSLLCPSHKDAHIEACSFKIECCLCGSSFNSKV